MQFLSFFVGLALASIIYAILSPLTPSESYTNTLNVNDQFALNYVMYWKLLSGGEIQFEVHCKTTGWVGIGWSTGGGMIGADIYIGWVANGVAKMKDVYAIAKVTPKPDTSQDVNLIEGREVNGYTILKFKRKLVTGDRFDTDIKVSHLG